MDITYNSSTTSIIAVAADLIRGSSMVHDPDSMQDDIDWAIDLACSNAIAGLTHPQLRDLAAGLGLGYPHSHERRASIVAIILPELRSAAQAR
tara:strand:+ start:1341 stop:1619 length:279 start_codon:yes stop_codon:yes gene_type:complete